MTFQTWVKNLRIKILANWATGENAKVFCSAAYSMHRPYHLVAILVLNASMVRELNRNLAKVAAW